MSQTKNNEGITSHLQRIFIYGDEMNEESRVNSFVEHCRNYINPFTNRPYEISSRSMYQYISGNQQFPFDLSLPLIAWSKDEKLMTAYNMYVAATEEEAYRAKIEEKEATLKKLSEDIALMRSRIR